VAKLIAAGVAAAAGAGTAAGAAATADVDGGFVLITGGSGAEEEKEELMIWVKQRSHTRCSSDGSIFGSTARLPLQSSQNIQRQLRQWWRRFVNVNAAPHPLHLLHWLSGCQFDLLVMSTSGACAAPGAEYTR
jgi:hypothetical protein